MRVKHTINPVVTEDTDGRSVLFGLDETTAETTLDGLQRAASGVTDLDDAEVFSIPYADVTDARGFFLRMDGGDFDLVINGGAVLQVRRAATGSGTVATSAKCLMDARTTSLQVTASGAGRLTWCIWGDPVA
jgi:hypothetical protein